MNEHEKQELARRQFHQWAKRTARRRRLFGIKPAARRPKTTAEKAALCGRSLPDYLRELDRIRFVIQRGQ